MWLYSQRTGELWGPSCRLMAVGYSGFGSGKNNPDLEDVRDVGPIPRGDYKIGEPYSNDTVGPHVIPLDPVEHDCHGRTDFRVHGDSRQHPGFASRGCIIMPPDIRRAITCSDDKILRVIE